MSIQLLIPQLFYDLIGRVVPGGILIIYFCVLTVTPNEILESLKVWINISLVAVVLIAILFSYVIGFLFGGLWFLFYRLFWWGVVKVAIEASVSKEFTDPPAFAANIDKLSFFTRMSLMYDSAQQHCQQTASRIVKLKAEQHMAGVLFFGFIAIMLGKWASFNVLQPMCYSSKVDIAVILASAIIIWHLEDRSCRALYNCWYHLATHRPRNEAQDTTTQVSGVSGCNI